MVTAVVLTSPKRKSFAAHKPPPLDMLALPTPTTITASSQSLATPAGTCAAPVAFGSPVEMSQVAQAEWIDEVTAPMPSLPRVLSRIPGTLP